MRKQVQAHSLRPRLALALVVIVCSQDTWCFGQRQAARLTLLGHNDDVFSVAFHPSGRILASGSRDGTVKLWDLRSGKQLRTLSAYLPHVYVVAFTKDGKTLAVGSGVAELDRSLNPEKYHKNEGVIQLWEVASGNVRATLKGHTGPVTSLAFTPDGMALVSGSTDMTVRLWDVLRGRHRILFQGQVKMLDQRSSLHIPLGLGRAFIEAQQIEHRESVTGLALSADGKTLAAATQTGHVYVLVLPDGKRWSAQHKPEISAVAISPDGKTLATGNESNNRLVPADVKLWDLARHKERAKLSGYNAPGICSIAFTPDSKTMATGTGIVNKRRTVVLSGEIRIWDTTRGNLLTVIKGHSDCIFSVAFSHDGKFLASGSADNTVKVWELSAAVSRSTDPPE
jgi:WD40 repeat protein